MTAGHVDPSKLLIFNSRISAAITLLRRSSSKCVQINERESEISFNLRIAAQEKAKSEHMISLKN